MRSVSVYDPFSLFRRELDRIFDDVLSVATTNRRSPDIWTPDVELRTTPVDVLVLVDLPGVSDNDIEVELLGDTLTLRGKRQIESADDAEIYISTLPVGNFERRIRLPVETDPHAEIDAHLANGVLTLRIPRMPSTVPKRITVRRAE